MTTEKWISELEAESKALKQGFDRSASNMSVFTKTVSITTTKNAITITEPGGFTTTSNDQERIVVTFNTKNGSNTIAKLEFTTSSSYMPIKRLTTYSGGARWILSNNPMTDGSGNWIETTYNLTVQSFLDGTLTASEATS